MRGSGAVSSSSIPAARGVVLASVLFLLILIAVGRTRQKCKGQGSGICQFEHPSGVALVLAEAEDRPQSQREEHYH